MDELVDIFDENHNFINQEMKSIAHKHGLHATFMPKPIFGIAGSGMHINISMAKDGKNVFCDDSDKNGLSSTAYSFIAGIMEHIKGMTAITNPLVNSYKRLVPEFEAPVYIAWSAQNRSPLIRVPASRGQGTRVELRSADPSANPYLALAVTIAAGLDGVKRGLVPPPAVDGNIYSMSAAQRKKQKIEMLPTSLECAIAELKKDKLICNTLGEHILEKYIEAKELEWINYKTRISQWEIDEYLSKY